MTDVRSGDRLHVAFLWHMHQPCYRVAGSAEYLLPWVRFHTIKDYTGMIEILREFPEVHATFNFVPVLLEQILAYSEGNVTDRVLTLTRKPAEELSLEERVEILEKFFRCNQDTMIQPYQRFNQLLERRGKETSGQALRAVVGTFTVQDFLDLQVWYNLTWFHYKLRTDYPDLGLLFAKGKNFTEADKRYVLELQLQIIKKVLGLYKQAADEGQIELSTSAYYHPILPLLIDNRIAKEANPGAPMPAKRFVFPNDALEQLQRAYELFTAVFERPPRGLWPSEGSISYDLVPFVHRLGFTWMASDEGILAKSLGLPFLRRRAGDMVASHLLYTPHLVNSKGVEMTVAFRDHVLSDRIGFVYSKWDPDKAVADFINWLAIIYEQSRAKIRKPIVFIILDGENAWEYYKHGGLEFLRGLYRALANTPWLRTVTISEYLEAHSRESILHQLKPGSWINANFDIWIGKPEKNKAWELLTDAREACELEPNPKLKQDSLDALQIAEGSDWFWWYDDDHFSEERAVFDQLFRGYLAYSYRVRGCKIPQPVLRPIIEQRIPEAKILEPSGLISPKITGKQGSYFEWLYAGSFEESYRFGAIHAAQGSLVQKIHFGFDLTTLYIRLDPSKEMIERRPGIKGSLTIHFVRPEEAEISFFLNGEKQLFDSGEVRVPGLLAFFEEIIEIAVPFTAIGITSGNDVRFFICLNLEGGWEERYPAYMEIAFKAPTQDFESLNWTAL